ncbi:hypothetical protein DOY81_001659 [Sarcophaga bullata]|nr:hypothetical protein DOY81_001659 [Sarcophaga bullata]
MLQIKEEEEDKGKKRRNREENNKFKVIARSFNKAAYLNDFVPALAVGIYSTTSSRICNNATCRSFSQILIQ